MPLFGRKAPNPNFVQMLKDLLNEGKEEAKSDPSKAMVTLRKIHRMIADADESEQLSIEQNKNDVINILLEAGSLLFDLGDKDKSIDYFEKVKELDPNNARAWFEIGRILVSQNLQIPYATVNLKKALELDKRNYRAMVLLGDLYKIQKDNENALKWYREALKYSPEKIEILDRILSLDPSNRDALRDKLTYYIEKGEKEKAAQIYLQLGIIEDNIDLLDEGLKITPDNVSILKEKARMLINHGKKSEATQFIERVKKLSPNDPEIPMLEEMVAEKKEEIHEDIFGDLGIGEETNLNVLPKEPDEEEILESIKSNKLPELIEQFKNSDTFIEKIDSLLLKNLNNYEIFIPLLEQTLKSSIDRNKLAQTRNALGQVFDAISNFIDAKYDESEKILNPLVVKDQKNALAWLYKSRIAALKNNILAAKNFLLMANKYGNFGNLNFPELRSINQ